MNQVVQFFLKIRNSSFFNGIVIFVIIGSAIYAGVSSYDLSDDYVGILNFLDTAITVFFLIEIIIRNFNTPIHQLRLHSTATLTS